MTNVLRLQLLLALLCIIAAAAYVESVEIVRTKPFIYDHSGSGELAVDLSASYETVMEDSEVS